MDRNFSHEKILIIIALALGSCIILYNAFYVPSANTPSVVYVDSSANTTSSSGISVEDNGESSENQKSIASNEKINLNTATQEDLSGNLDGVGEAIAKRIIEYRDTYGKFSSIDELKNVAGIGEKTFEKIKTKVCI